jgi:hypothetical protein
MILVFEHHHLWLKGSIFYSLPFFVSYLKHQWLSISIASKPNTVYVWVLNFQDQIKKNILDFGHPLSAFKFCEFSDTSFCFACQCLRSKTVSIIFAQVEDEFSNPALLRILKLPAVMNLSVCAAREYSLLRQISESGNNKSRNLCKFCGMVAICRDSETMECQFHTASLLSKRLKLSPVHCDIQMMWKNRLSILQCFWFFKKFPSHVEVMLIKWQCILICLPVMPSVI